jgi:hypothetical protein
MEKYRETTEIKWNLYDPRINSISVRDIVFKPFKYEKIPSPKEKIKVIVKIGDSELKILNLPQNINQIYPVILVSNPRIVIYGFFNRYNGNLNYFVQVKVNENENKKIFSSVFGLGFIPLYKKVKRMSYTPIKSRYSYHVFMDAKDAIKSFKTRKKKDIELNNYLKTFSEEDRIRKAKSYSFFSILFFIIFLAYSIYCAFSHDINALFVCIPSLLFSLLCLRSRHKIIRSIEGISDEKI